MPHDLSNLLNFKLTEMQKQSVKVPDLQAPYLHLSKPNPQISTQIAYNRSRRRIVYSTPEEVDCAVSEANRIKKIIYRHNLGFEDWFNTLEQKSKEN